MRLNLLVALHHHSTRVLASISMLFLVTVSLFLGKWSIGLNLDREHMALVMRSDVFLFWIALIVAPLAIRALVVCREGVSVTDYVKGLLFQTSLFVATIWPVIRRLATPLIGGRVGFNATGTAPVPSFLQIIVLDWIGFGLIWATLVAVLFNPFLSLLNLLWIVID